MTEGTKVDGLVKSPRRVIPAKAGIYNQFKTLDPRIRGDDNKEGTSTFYETIKVVGQNSSIATNLPANQLNSLVA